MQARIIKKEELCASKFLRFVNITYERQPGTPQTWQACERTTTDPKIGVDAVAVFAVLKSATQEPRVLVVKQFRPPLAKSTVELCAGLVDPGETVQEAALRELKEETGYIARVVGTTGQQYLSPGLTNENIVTVFAEIDADAVDTSTLKQSEEDEGMITVTSLSLTHLMEELEALEKEGYGIWVGLYAIAQGMRMNKLLGL